VKRLRGVDAYHVFEETPSQHMHTIKVLMVEPAEPITAADVRGWAAATAPGIPPLRWRLVPIPFGLGRPLWVEDGPLNLGYHVRSATIGPDGLDELVGRIASVPLDRMHPLWQLWFVDGLADGQVALVLKIHHAVADGMASVRILEELFGARPLPAAERPAPEPLPSAPQRIAGALRSQAIDYAHFPHMVRRTAANLASGRASKRGGAAAAVKPYAAPMTRFNEPLTAERTYADVTVPFADIAAIRVAIGATVNDVFVTLCGGALRRYLLDHDALPDAALTATAPVSLRGEDDDEPYGNHGSYWPVTLATDIADPRARLAAVKASTMAARAWSAGDRSLLTDWADYYGLYRLVAVELVDVAQILARRPVYNAVVSNVRGPRPLTFFGSPVVAVRSMGPIVGAQAVNLTAWTYGEAFSIGIHACRAHVPDVGRLAACIREELGAMLDAAGVSPRPSGAATGR
jgi:diacylglycerol O-acyltransferase